MGLEEASEHRYSLGQKLWWVIIGRLASAVILFIARGFWIHGGNLEAWVATLAPLFIVAGLTVLYALARTFSKALLLQARVQFVIDIILVTWLVWTTDVIHSPYIAIYIVVIAASGLFLGPRDAVVISVACAIAFTAGAIAILNGSGRIQSAEVLDATRVQSFQTVGLFDIAFLVVGLLSARLAAGQSRSEVRLKAATQSLATLRALHERIVESIRSGVVTTDLQRRIYTFNAAAEEITGYHQETVRGTEASVFFGDMKDCIERSLRALETGTTSPRFETDCLTPEGLRLRLGFSVSPLSSEFGEITGMVITFQDLTQ